MSELGLLGVFLAVALEPRDGVGLGVSPIKTRYIVTRFVASAWPRLAFPNLRLRELG